METWLIFLGCGCIRWSGHEPFRTNQAAICKQHPSTADDPWPARKLRLDGVQPVTRAVQAITE